MANQVDAIYDTYFSYNKTITGIPKRTWKIIVGVLLATCRATQKRLWFSNNAAKRRLQLTD